MAEIKDVRVWSNPTKSDWRVYVHMDDGREGCRYITGNHWHAAKSIDGNLTAEEWKAARTLAYDGKTWHTVYNDKPAPAPTPAPVSASKAQPRRQRCPDCGEYDCPGAIGGDCDANRWSSRPAAGDGHEHAQWETEEGLAQISL